MSINRTTSTTQEKPGGYKEDTHLLTAYGLWAEAKHGSRLELEAVSARS